MLRTSVCALFTSVLAIAGASFAQDGFVIEDTVTINQEIGAYSVTKTARVCFDPVCPAVGQDCCENDRPRVLTLRYTGEQCDTSRNSQPDKSDCEDFTVDPLPADVYVIISRKSCASGVSGKSIYFDGDVTVGQEIVIDAADVDKDELSSNTYVCIYDSEEGTLLQEIKIHTSCSAPLFVGDSFGAMAVVDCIGKNEPVEGDCCANGKPVNITMLYTQQDCDATSHAQDPGKVNCEDFAPLTSTAFIRSTDKSNPYDTGGRIWFEGNVDVDTTFDISAIVGGEDKLSSATFIHIFDVEGGALLQSVEFHTSCSQPLLEGNRFGAATVVACVGEDEPVLGDCCSQGKLVQLVLEYTGEDCKGTGHSQDPSKVSCEDFGTLPSDVFVVVSKKDCADGSGASANSIYFMGDVSVDGTIMIDAADVGRSTLDSKTYVCVYDAEDGSLLQAIEFHTSCSQPLVAGDQFGSMRIVGCVGEDGPVVVEEPCDPFPNDGLFTYCYELSNSTESPLALIRFELLVDPSDVVDANFIANGGVEPSGVRITSTRVEWEFFDVLIAPGQSSAKLYITSPLGPDSVPAAISGQAAFDTPTTCLGPAVVCEFCQDGRTCFSCPSGPVAGPPCPPPSEDCCDAGDPRVLSLSYTAEGCDATANDQGDKDDCTDFSGGVLPRDVYIVVSKDSDCSQDIYFSGNVSVGVDGGAFTVDAAAIGASKFASNTYFCIYDMAGGTLLQTVQMHTSCSVPLFTNDRFGSIELNGCLGEDE